MMKSDLVKSLGCFRADVQKLMKEHVVKHHQKVVDACENGEGDKLVDLCWNKKFRVNFTVCICFLLCFTLNFMLRYVTVSRWRKCAIKSF